MSFLSPAPLIARSSDGSLIGVHQPGSASSGSASSGSSAGLIRCYDGSVSNGSLKFTLRHNNNNHNHSISASSSSSNNNHADDALRKLVFAGAADAPPKFLCGMTSSSIVVWDLDRGVASHSIAVSDSASKREGGGGGRRRSGDGDGGEAVLCDVAAAGGMLFALVCVPSTGKCRVHQYDVTNERETLVKKIKAGSVGAGAAAALAAAGELAIAVSASETRRWRLAIRTGNLVRILDGKSGDKLAKKALFHSGGDGHVAGAAPPLLQYSRDGSCLATTSFRGHRHEIVVFSIRDDDEKVTLRQLALLTPHDASACITELDVDAASEKDRLSLVAFQHFANVASFFAVDAQTDIHADANMAPQTPTVKLHSDGPISLLSASFRPNHNKNDHDHTTPPLLLLFRDASSSAALPMEILPRNALRPGTTLRVGSSLDVADAIPSSSSSGKKRKAAVNVAMAPGDRGTDAVRAADWTAPGAEAKSQNKKRKKKKEEDESALEEENEEEEKETEEDFALDDDDDDDGERNQSIAEKLALLSSAMEQSDDDNDDDDDNRDSGANVTFPKNYTKAATSETLTTLLTQALSSNDMAQLNIVLQVTNKRMVENTVRELQILDAEKLRNSADEHDKPKRESSGYILMLMGHLVRRMARRHSVVVSLGVWVKAILAAVARGTTSRYHLRNGMRGDDDHGLEERIAKEAKDMALKLGPLKNFLNERVECFPQLLRLEGRLALLSQQL